MQRMLTKPQAIMIAVVIVLVAGLLRGALPAGDGWRVLDAFIFGATILAVIAVWRRTQPRREEP